MLLCWATIAIVVAALTTWWVLMALLPLLMMMSGMAMMGMTAQYLKDAKRGMAAVDQRIAYRREALPGDVVTIRTAIIEVRPKSVRFVHEMRRGDLGDLLATMVVTGVHIDGVGRRATEFDKQIHAKSLAMKVADTTLWDAWPPAKAYLE